MDWKSTGDAMQITGRVKGTSGLVIRDQLLGYHQNVDEPVIPIISAADDLLSGFYRIDAVDVPTTPAAFVASKGLDYVIHGTRIGSFKSAYHEAFITGALMVNAQGIASTVAEPFHAFPSQAYEYNNPSQIAIVNRPTVDASVNVSWVRMQPSYKALARWAQTAATFYNAACVIKDLNHGSAIVVGQRSAPTATGWELSNGLFKMWLNTGGYFSLTWGDATNTYRTAASMYFAGAAAGSFYSAAGINAPIKIIRNAPEECIIRVPVVPVNGLGYTPTYVDVSIRRGSRIAHFFLASTYATDTWQFGNITGGIASTAVTGGNVWTANDAYGNRVVIFSARATTNDLVNGKITASATSATLDAGVAMELGGTASTAQNTALSQFYQYLAAQAERMQVVGR